MADSLSGTVEPARSRRRVLVWSSLAGVLVVVLAASLWLSGAIPWFHDDPLPETVQKPRPVRRLQAEPLLAVAPASLPVAVRDRYRPRPDRRLLLAVAEVQRLRKGTPPELVQAEFQDGKWRILSGKDEVGTLPEIPTFDEATDLLARWAARLPAPAATGSAGHPEIAGEALDRAVRELDSAALLTALSKLGSDAQGDEARVRSTTAGLAWLSTLTATPAAGTAAELRRWIELKGQALDGARDSRPPVEFMESARSIGPAPLADLAVVINRQSESTEPLRRRPIPALFARLDTRPPHLGIAARLAQGSLTSPGLFETFARAAAEGAPHLSEELPALAAEMREDSVRLRQIADDPAMPQYARAVALAAMAKLDKADAAFVRARYEASAADPDQGPDLLVWLLEKNGDLRGALAAEEAAIRRGSYHGELALAHLLTEKARLQLALGDPEGAFTTIEPAIDEYKEETLLQAATIELARHHPENALKLAQASLERYPRNASDTSGLIARARWQLGDDATAAKELAANRNGLLAAWNRYLPESFAEAFATAPEDSVRRAFSEMVAAGIAPHILARAAIALGEKRGLAITMPLLAGLHDPAPEWRDVIRLATYDLILKKSGKDAALDWVKKGMADRPHNFALALYQMRKYELLLGLYPEGQESMKPGLIRMLKAASLLHLRETRGPRWDGVVAEIAKDPGDDFFARGARYLTGGIDAAEILRQPVSVRAELASLGWLMGVKAASERRFADADGWFQVALESGQEQQPPDAWSFVIESDLQKVHRSLTVLETKGDF